MSYSCNPNHPNQQWSADTSKARPCRFSERHSALHQSLGCAGCPRPWDTEYLSKMGFDVEVKSDGLSQLSTAE